ncbi:MAG: N-acetyl-gamma-glutamyl-phosphate reductase [bacterium]
MNTTDRIGVAIAGITGYTGIELARILSRHPRVELRFLGGRSRAGEPLEAGAPSLSRLVTGEVEAVDAERIAARADVAFLALPHGAAAEVAVPLLERGTMVIDLSADFRLRDPEIHRAWYGEHKAPALIGTAIYAMPEIARAQIRGARFLASPGCYPTAATLSLAPLVAAGWIDATDLIVDSKSGASGAGRGASVANLLAETGEAIHAYNVTRHRHTPEIEMALGMVGGCEARVTFTPHLVPMSRGILSTAYARPRVPRSAAEVQELYERHYRDEPFVRVLPQDRLPDTAHVRGSNFIDIAVRVDQRAGGRIIALAAIDNLVKGASGQAVQAMNIALGFAETCGLDFAPMFP